MPEPGRPKDRWDKLAVVLQPIGGLLTAVAVAGVGYWGSNLLDKRQTSETNARLYSELMSRREEAESGLRKDMFGQVMQSFLSPSATTLDARVLKLELLAYNFHDSLNLKPLFLDTVRAVHRERDPERTDYLVRLNRVAREITGKQLFSLEGHGHSFRRSVDFEALAAAGRAGLPLDPEPVALGSDSYEVRLRVLSYDPDLQSLKLRLEVKPAPGATQAVETRATFELGFYDFPLIDNTRLASGQRCAVAMSAFDRDVGAELTGVCFPGEYASLKDRPYYDEVIRQLRSASSEAAAPR